MDLLLELPAGHLIDAPQGTLLDDHLTTGDRADMEAEGIERLAEWRRTHDAALTIDDAPLAWIWEIELLAEVFLAEIRIMGGLARVATRAGVARVELLGSDPETAEGLGRVLDRDGIELRAGDSADRPVPRYPGRRANPWPRSLASRMAGAALRPWGVPALGRGNVLFTPYWHLLGLHDRLLSEPGLVPLHDPVRIPAGPLSRRVRAALKGGWVGRPNAVQAKRSRAQVLEALHALSEPVAASDDPLGALLDRRARRLIEQRAAGTPAQVRSLTRALRRPRAKAALVAFDSPPDGRVIVSACRAARRPSMVVQHGFYAESNDPDKTEADLAAVSSEADRELLASRRRGPVEVTGNPGVDGISPGVTGDEGRTLVLPMLHLAPVAAPRPTDHASAS